jgi:peptidoglycan glycosyltransferase
MAVFLTMAGLGILGAVAVVGTYLALSRDLIAPSALEQIEYSQESVIYDRTGQTELARFGNVRREVVTFDQIPAILLDATTAVEDKSFWTNPGFDPAAIIASGLDAIRGSARGGSTITQQLVRARLLDPELVQASGRTVERKLKEIFQSIRVTKAYPGLEGKERIITAYLNQNFYGNNSYGVAAAARSYFGKSLDRLTASEAAILAALPQSPTTYDLVRNAVLNADGQLVVPAASDIVQRRNRVLELMADGRTPLSEMTWTAAQLAAAKAEPVILVSQATANLIAPHFVWAVREELTTTLCGDLPTCPGLERGGFRIMSTLDLRLQQIAEKWVKAAAVVPNAKDPAAAAKALGLTYQNWMKNLRGKSVNNGALVALDYQTGELVAYVGSADYYATNGSPQFQPQFDIVGNGWRQPGSTFKPFNYLVGIDDGRMTAASLFMDVGVDFGGGYTPADADRLERGPVRLRSALQFSLNIPSVKAMAVNGPQHVFDRARELGLVFRDTTTQAGLALGVGVEEVRAVDLVTGYGTIANDGRYLPHTTMLRIVGADGGDVVPPHQAGAGTQVVKPEAAAIITDILAGNTDTRVNPFWGKFAIVDGKIRRPATLKTGTNDDASDLNAYGYIAAPDSTGRSAGEYALAVGAWNGNSDNSPVSTPERPVYSSDVATYVWQGFVAEATAGWTIQPFQRPASLQSVAVEPFTGLRAPDGATSVRELFIEGTTPSATAGGDGGVCGTAVLEVAGFETRDPKWLAADQDWIARALRGPGVRGGVDRNPTAYFYNSSYAPWGRSWGPLLDQAPCASPTPEPSPTCIPLPTPDASGLIPTFELPTPDPSGLIPPGPLACATEEPSASPSVEPTPTETPAATVGPPPTCVPFPTIGPGGLLPSIDPSLVLCPTLAPSSTPSPTPTPTPTPQPSVEPSPAPT